MLVQCERCKQNKECTFRGKAGDVIKEEAQTGIWVCDDCLKPLLVELDKTIERLQQALEEE